MRENILTVDQVSKILQVHPFTVLKYIKQGKLKGSKLGRMYRIRETDLDAFLNKQLTDSQSKEKNASQSEKPNKKTQPSAPSKTRLATPDPKIEDLDDQIDKNYILE